MKIKAIIVDDEKNSREVLRSLLGKFCPEVVVLNEAPNVELAYLQILEQNPDLVFLDIQMPMSNGFSLLQKFDPVPFSVIFVTSYDHYAIHAIKFSALDYLLKPIEVSDLKAAVTKAISKKEEMGRYVVNLLDNIEESSPDKKIPVHVQGNVRFINSSSISHIEADGAYSNIHSDGGKYSCSKTLKEFEDFLANNPAFIRINKSVMINVKHMKEYSKGEPFFITMNSGDTFESSRRRKPEVLEKIKAVS